MLEDFFKLAIGNLKRRKLRSSLTIIGIFIAGILLSQTMEHYHIFSEVRPIRDLLGIIFFVKKNNKTVYIIETKGREEEDDKLKFERLQKWCKDVNSRQSRVEYKALYIKQEEWEKYKLKSFDEAV